MSYTTKDPTARKENDWYTYISKQEFFDMLEAGHFFESTMYASHGYGSRKEEVNRILENRKIVLATMDICGAMALKTHYSKVLTVYIKRDRRALLSAILDKNSSNEDKVNRIIAIDQEKRNAEICDQVVENIGYEETADAILSLLHLI